jgi:uncharacterized protein YneF (UPF0154 family)
MKISNALDSISWGIGFTIILLVAGLCFNIFISNEAYGVGDIIILCSPLGFLLGLATGLYISMKREDKTEG